MLAGTVMLTGYTGLWAGPETAHAADQAIEIQADGVNEARFLQLYGQLKTRRTDIFLQKEFRITRLKHY